MPLIFRTLLVLILLFFLFLLGSFIQKELAVQPTQETLISNSSREKNLKRQTAQETTKIGNPYINIYLDGEDIYSRNIWDMKSYQGLLFFGAGNSKNSGPSTNSGPVPIISYNPSNGLFLNEGVIKEEQINNFRVINEQLYIPGHDATQNWDFGSFYKRSGRKWKQYRTIPGALHVYDLFASGETFFCAAWINKKAAIGISADQGENWTMHPLKRGKTEHIIKINNTIYALNNYRKKNRYYLELLKFNGNQFITEKTFDFESIFPNTSEQKLKTRLLNVATLNNQVFYIPAYQINKTSFIPFGLYIATFNKNDNISTQRIKLEENEIPRDILIKNNMIFLLITQQQQAHVVNRVVKYLPHKNQLIDIIEFNSVTFARSFEWMGDNFYFSLGSDINNKTKWDIKELLPATGDILTVTYSEIK